MLADSRVGTWQAGSDTSRSRKPFGINQVCPTLGPDEKDADDGASTRRCLRRRPPQWDGMPQTDDDRAAGYAAGRASGGGVIDSQPARAST